MSRSQLLQFDLEEEFWEDSRRHATWLYNRVPPSRYVPGEPWLSPIQKQYPERKVTDLSQLHPFGTECWTHLISRKLEDPVRVMVIPEGNMVSLLDMMMTRDHY